MNWNSIKVAPQENGVLLITLNRPQVLNALDQGMRRDFQELIPVLQDPAVRAVVFTGAGRAFCAGGDIGRLKRRWDPAEFSAEGRLLSAFFNALEDLPKPVLAAVNGPAAGAGMLLALACDLRVASSDARMGFREHRLGLIPSNGGTWRLARLLGLSRAKALYFKEDLATAAELLQLGLVARVTEPRALLDETLSWAGNLCRRAPLALAEAKALLNRVPELGRDEAVLAEEQAQERMIASQDHSEGVAAFAAKRKPVFRGV